jgi:hypothetical protein
MSPNESDVVTFFYIRLRTWEELQKQMGPFDSSTIQPFHEKVSAFMRKHTALCYNEFRGQCRPWETSDGEYRDLPVGHDPSHGADIRRSFFDHWAR